MVAGDQFPVIGVELDDWFGNVGGMPPRQISAMAGNAGIIPGVIVTLILTGLAHCPGEGVKV